MVELPYCVAACAMAAASSVQCDRSPVGCINAEAMSIKPMNVQVYQSRWLVFAGSGR